MCFKSTATPISRAHLLTPPPSRNSNRRLWGLNGLRQWIQADSRHRLLQLILFHMRQSGWTIQGKFMNKTVFFTVDPANLEAMLNSKASGTLTYTHTPIMSFPIPN